jgi:hypothetical protein
MKTGYTTLALTLAAVLAGASFAAAGAETKEPNKANAANAAEVEQKIDQAYDAMKGYGYARKQEFVKWAEARTAELDRRITALRKEVGRADTRARTRLEKEMGDLEKKRRELGVKTGELQRSSAQAWSDVKWGFAAAVDSLEQAYDKASARFKEEQEAAQKPRK